MKKIRLIFLVFFFTGCFNYHELNDLAITTALGIDKTNDGLYKVTVQILNTKKSSKESSSSQLADFTIYTREEKTIQEALRKIILDSSKKIYAHHIQLLVIGDSLARDGIKDVIEFFFRNPDSRKQFLVLIAKEENAQNVLSILTPQESLSAQNIKKILLNDNKYLGVNQIISFEQLVSDYLDETKEIVLPTVRIIGNQEIGSTFSNLDNTKPNSRLTCDSMAIFKSDKLYDYLNMQDSISLNFITNKINNTVYSYECDNNKYIVGDLFDSKTKLSVNDNLEVEINIKSKMNIDEVMCNLDLTNINNINEIEQNFEEKLKKEIELFFYKIVSDKIDVFGIGDYLYKNKTTLFKKIKNNYLSYAKPIVNVDIQIVSKGNSLKVVN